MSIMYCEKHDRRWDSDKLEECPLCENEPSPADKDDEALFQRWLNEPCEFVDAHNYHEERLRLAFMAGLKAPRPESRTINAAPEQRAEASSLVPAQPGDPANVAGNATGAAPTATATPEKWCTCPPTTCEQRSDGWCHLPRGPVRDELAFRSTIGRKEAGIIADTIIADYRAHYNFPPQGESHLHDCIMDALEGYPHTAPASATQERKE